MAALLLDTNLLILFVVGRASRTFISSHKRLQAYDEKVFDLLEKTILGFDDLVLTPNILTEASNLARQFHQPGRDLISRVLAEIVDASSEIYVESQSISTGRTYLRLGLTDAGIVSLNTTNLITLTDDLDLYVECTSQGKHAINFTHLREAAGI